jgi:hypothetical protein
MRTVGELGTHGAGITGTHGIGVKTPRAAAVAEITCGFEGALHIPNGGMLTIGTLSIIVAAGVPVNTRFCGSTTSEDGATPKLHCIIAPIQTWIPIAAA